MSTAADAQARKEKQQARRAQLLSKQQANAAAANPFASEFGHGWKPAAKKEEEMTTQELEQETERHGVAIDSSINRMLKTAAQANQTGAATLDKLNAQGEQVCPC